jgi:hypothetical protein
MAFDRKDFGMNGHIPFTKIADRVEVTVDFKATRVSGLPLQAITKPFNNIPASA